MKLKMKMKEHHMAAQPRRVPGQSNEDYENRHDPNADFHGVHSLVGGGDLSWVDRIIRAALRRWDRRRKRSV